MSIWISLEFTIIVLFCGDTTEKGHSCPLIIADRNVHAPVGYFS